MLSFLSPARALVAAAGLAIVAAPALAQAQSDVKLGYFDVKRILSEVEEAKAAKTKLQRDFDEKQKQLDVEKKEIERLSKEYEQKRPVLAPTAREQLEADLQAKMLKAQKLYVELQQDLAQKEQQALADLITRLEPVVRELAQDEGYTYIFEKNEAGLFYAPAGHDLTAQVIRRYNQRFPGKGGGKAEPKKTGDKK